MNDEFENLVIDGNENFDFANYALSFKNINNLEFRNCDFFKEDIIKLAEYKEYNRIAFIECSFEDATLINNIKTKSLSFTNDKITNYEFVYQMNNLERLTIVDGIVDADKINLLKNLEYLRISNSLVNNIDKLFLNKLKYLFIDNTNITDITFIKNLSNLELLSISEEQELNNKEIINEIKNNIKIILDSIIEMEFPYDE